MKPFRICSAVLSILAALLSAVTIVTAVCSISGSPRILRSPDSARERTEELMELICQGNFDDAGLLLRGTPDLGISAPEAGTPEALIWDAWMDSLEYEFAGECYVTQNGIARDVTIQGMDISQVTQAISSEVQLLLEERLAHPEDGLEIYDGDGKLSPAFTNQILYDATARCLESRAHDTTCTLTLYLEYADGQWMIVPDAQLQAFLSGQLPQ